MYKNYDSLTRLPASYLRVYSYCSYIMQKLCVLAAGGPWLTSNLQPTVSKHVCVPLKFTQIISTVATCFQAEKHSTTDVHVYFHLI